ncbi:MAG TPA: hypothetical protein VGR82_15510 [Methylomirabilota bacterium]|jgi:hypothetical protein|nr:hypothetical protein [Methylomirabilota bacterium]
MSPTTLDGLVRRVVAQVRRRRAEHHAIRGLFWASLPAVALLALKGPLGPRAVPLAVGLLLAGMLAGAAWGWLKRTTHADAARLADRAFGLEDRVATALEWAGRDDRTPLVETLVTDATERVARLEPRTIVRRILPREARWLPVPVLVACALTLAPAIPMPSVRLPDFTPGAEEEEKEARSGAGTLEERTPREARERLRPPAFEEREFSARSGAASASTAGDLSAVFKDTSLSSQRPDFNSFLKKGDERLKLLEQVDRLPDLASDFTASQYKMVFRKSKALAGGLRPDQISPKKLKELLEEMERLGRKGGSNWSGEVGEGMEALEGGQTDRAMEAMQKALDKMRAQEEAQRSGKGLRGGRDSDRAGARDRRGGEGGEGDQDFGDGEGLLPGRGKSGSPKGDATRRLQANPYDVGVEGESRRGRKDGYDTNMTGRGGPMASRLQYLGVIGQYRKMMEDAITREAVPRDYHSQIKDYFQALDER